MIGEVRRWSSSHSKEHYAVFLVVAGGTRERYPGWLMWRCLVLDGTDPPGHPPTHPGSVVTLDDRHVRESKRIV